MNKTENKKPVQQHRGILHLLKPEHGFLLWELICSGKAAFDFIRFSQLDSGYKSAFHQLEKQFDFYKSKLTGEE